MPGIIERVRQVGKRTIRQQREMTAAMTEASEPNAAHNDCGGDPCEAHGPEMEGRLRRTPELEAKRCSSCCRHSIPSAW
ncbi:MAG TPA: hypothetical protein VH165_17945 [Kofleriaceae bacterium]|nr:hypothetical protein [Kofleriaceae bacterium]